MPVMIIWIAFEALPVKANTQPWFIIPCAFQYKAPFSSAKATSSYAYTTAKGLNKRTGEARRR